MKKTLLLVLPILLLCQQTMAQKAATNASYWQQQADYTIDVKLNDTTHTLDGTVHISYYNQSPDTLHFVWIHLWPNAYKNDKTAFSEQMLLLGNTDFYFSKSHQKGYINRINITANGKPTEQQDHPNYIDVIKVLLPQPLLPGKKVELFTPFHVQLPELFSRSGHDKQFYSITQWFPKIAMYDAKGWHPMPYLSMGEYYSNFGNYKVSITLPENYVVAATGSLQNASEKAWLQSRNKAIENTNSKPVKKELFKTGKVEKYPTPTSSKRLKTLHYTAEKVVDFAWFADKRFVVKYDTVQLSNHNVDVWNFVLPEDLKRWENSLSFSKRALKFYSQQLGNYPYPQVSVVSSPKSEADGMEYPMVTLLNVQMGISSMLDEIIAHEIGHNWFEAVLATNERTHAWMDEGMNTFIERKYMQQYYPKKTDTGKSHASKIPEDLSGTLLNYLYETRQDVPIESAIDTVLPLVHYPITYNKTGDWLEFVEQKIGAASMDKMMREYFTKWQFKHPQPDDFKALVNQYSGQSMEAISGQLAQKGPFESWDKRKTKLTGLFNLSSPESKKYIGIAPAIGLNQYDKFEIGLLLHNYNLPAHPFQFVITPMLGTGSKQPVGYGRFNYHWYPNKKIHKAELYAGLSHFAYSEGIDQNGNKLPVSFTKFAPGLSFELKKRNTLSTVRRWIDAKVFVLSEQQLKLQTPPPPGDTVYFASRNGSTTTIIPQVTVGWSNDRKLYTWSVEAQVQHVKQIIRTSITAKYFLNYDASDKGLAVRLFAGKIFYTTEKTTTVQNNNSRYHFTLYAPNGWQDYTYSNPFNDRNQSTQLGGRQIMMRDGGFKYRSDFSSVVPGLSSTGADYFDNWLFAINTEFDIPNKVNPLAILPFKTGLKIFADAGTSASPWKSGSAQSKFLYSIGLHLPLLKVIHLYYPIIQSKSFNEPNSVNDPFKAGGPSWWQKRLTFSLDLEALKPKPGGFRII